MIWSPKTATYVAAFLAILLLVQVVWASTKTPHPSATLEPCALVLDQNGQRCR